MQILKTALKEMGSGTFKKWDEHIPFNQAVLQNTVVSQGWRWSVVPYLHHPLVHNIQLRCRLWMPQMPWFRPVLHFCSLPVQAELVLSNPPNVYFDFGRQWKYTPAFYLIAAGTFVGGSISSTILVLPQSSSSCTRGRWLCSTVFPPLI